MLILGPSNSGLKKLINIQKCPSSTKVDHCAMVGIKKTFPALNRYFFMHEKLRKTCKSGALFDRELDHKPLH